MRYATLAIVAAIGFATPAAAAPSTETVSVHVNYRDLDIATPQGLAKLQRRVKLAVRRACAEATSGTLYGYMTEGTCRVDSQQLADREIERHRTRSLALLELRPG